MTDFSQSGILQSNFLQSGRQDAPFHVILAHGAGAPMTSPFMEVFAALLAERDIAVSRFEFAYMAARREGGKRRPPPKAESLEREYGDAITALRETLAPSQKLFIGGKSLGGRVASMVAGAAFDAGKIAGLICLGYPFHPPGKPDQLRTAHLETLTCPTLIVQGVRDPFGSRLDVAGLDLAQTISFLWAEDGDHDLGPRGASGFTRKGNLTAGADAVAAFMAKA